MSQDKSSRKTKYDSDGNISSDVSTTGCTKGTKIRGMVLCKYGSEL